RTLSLSYPEHKLTQFFIKNLKAKDVFYDVGSNYGFYSYLASEFCAEVHSFDPSPQVFANLQLNLSGHPNLYLNNVAVSDRNGEATLHISTAPGVSTVSDEFLNARLRLKVKYGKAVTIPTIALDE